MPTTPTPSPGFRLGLHQDCEQDRQDRLDAGYSDEDHAEDMRLDALERFQDRS